MTKKHVSSKAGSANRSPEKFLGSGKIFQKFLPRNNKLSQVTVHLFLGPKQAAVSNSKKYYKPKRKAADRTLVIILFFRVGYNWLLVKQSYGALQASGLDTAQGSG